MKIIYYIQLTKPKIILGNILSIMGGFFMASKGVNNYYLLLKILIGISFIIAGNCILNNIIEHNVDSLMERTKNRAIMLKLITIKHAFLYAILFIFLGFIILFYTTNIQIIYLAIISSFIYIGIYTLFLKKKPYIVR